MKRSMKLTMGTLATLVSLTAPAQTAQAVGEAAQRTAVPSPTSLGANGNVAARGTCPEYHYLLVRYGMPVSYFSRVMYRESRCTPTAYNGRNRDRSYGLLQINTKGSNWEELQRRCNLTSRDQLFNPRTNVACASKLYKAYGRKPWGG